jgi:hypothetical protein
VTLNLDSPFTDPVAWDTIRVAGVEWFGKFEIRGAKRAFKWDVKDGLGLQGAIETYRGQTPPPFTINFYLWADQHFDQWPEFIALFNYNAAKQPSITGAALTNAKAQEKAAYDTLTYIETYLQKNPPRTQAAIQAGQKQLEDARRAVAQASGAASKAAATGVVPSPGVKPVDIYHPQLALVGIHQVICEDYGPPEKQSDDLMFMATVSLREYFPPLPINTTTTPDSAADAPEPGDTDPAVVSREKRLDQLMQTAINAGAL